MTVKKEESIRQDSKKGRREDKTVKKEEGIGQDGKKEEGIGQDGKKGRRFRTRR
jgi:hypothetical protein